MTSPAGRRITSRWRPAAVALAACMWLMAAAAADDTSRGRAVYGDYCQNCHGADAAGLAMFRGSLEEFRARLAFSENMPDMSGLLTADEVAAVYAFVVAAQLQSP